ncbi:glycoside hydrolase [Actinomadura livida]|uniref:Exo-alpha-sialidase n=1 Tax=Actinomadura livida TaxID=79909 RepID=A0A7W7IHI4_9ACTN|nr:MULTISPECIES: glycoside hydrolase [Actinomadura]MBB4777105.1 hypothetical protein [Actinomadura catellatispora]GGU21674.1 hypothetical protein GCM10010208_53430 [Actinomadura livida]
MTASTPEQDEARRTAEQEAGGSRQVRRRLTFGVAGDLADMPATLSPWQRAYEAWRAAGLKWGHGAPPRREQTPEAAETASTGKKAGAAKKAAPKKPAGKKPAGKKDAGKKSDGKKGAGKKAALDPADVLVAGPGLAAARKGAAPRRLRSRLAVATGLMVVAGGAIFTVTQGESGSDEPGVPAPVAADALFAPDPAAETDGLVQELTAVTSAGGTLVAVGTEGDGAPGRERSRFLYSVDAGRTWSLARLRSAGGPVAPAGDSPDMVTAGDRGWVALGRSSGGGTVAWTSENAQTWTRHDLGAVFKPSDDVRGVARTATGFVAVGGADDHAVAWISPDGSRWQRIEGIEGIGGFDGVASSGSVLVSHGTYPRKVTVKRGRRKITRTVPSHGAWRSTDGGRTWARVNIPQSHGSYGPTKGLAFGPGGFATVREGRHTSGRKNKRRTTRFGLLFTSADGREWRAVSRFRGAGIERFGGTPDGLAVLVRGADGASQILRTDDGRTWRQGGTVAGPVESSGLTVASGGAIAISGSKGDDAYLHGVDLRTVPGAVRPERAVRSLAGTPGRSVAVGSSNGAAAIWTSPDGRAWQRARFPGTGGSLSDVVEGAAGWLAVGRTSGDSPAPLAMTSQDGVAWEKAAFPAGPAPAAAATGPAGYVAAASGAIWRSADLKTWRRTEVDGAPSDVTATAGKYVAVGGKGRAPAVWTSPDGAKWTAAELPGGLASGPLTAVAAHGGVLVATGTDGAPLVSADGGTTWAPHGLGGDLNATAITATPRGFVAAASTSRRDAEILASADGVTWRRLRVPGLAGAGEQRLTAMTTAGSSVLATGVAADAHTETPLLWKAPVPE